MMISVIMPVYNSEKFIKEAINSVIKQDYSNFELLLVDDGSTDGSSKICDFFARQDSRIHVFHKENGGVCSARNIGINHAKGDYVAFIDNDDVYDKSYLSTLIEYTQTKKPDIIKCGRKNIKITKNQKALKEVVSTVCKDDIYNSEKFRANYYDIKMTGILSSVWNGLYKTSFLRNNNLFFREDLKHGNEDLIFNYLAFCVNSQIVLCSKVLYIHYYRISHSTSTRFFDDQITSRIEAINIEREILNKSNNDTERILVEFEGIRECFKILAQCKNRSRKKNFISLIFNNINLQIFKDKGYIINLLTTKQKIDWFLFKHKLYSCYFLYKRIQDILGK